jgi:hypothetical protein
MSIAAFVRRVRKLRRRFQQAGMMVRAFKDPYQPVAAHLIPTRRCNSRLRVQIRVDRAAIEARVQAQVAQWRTLLTASVDDGRQLLREVLRGPLMFTPTAEG